MNTDHMFDICQDFTVRMEAEFSTFFGPNPNTRLVFPEPYIPHLPSPDPEILVLAEAQNLSDTNMVFREELEKLDALNQRDLFRRLDYRHDRLGIEPWDNGTLRVAVSAMFRDTSLEDVAVSNAIPWSFITPTGGNSRPFNAAVKNLAAEFWDAIFEVWKPGTVVAAGAVARDVMRRTGLPSESVIPLVLPSPRWDGAAGMFDPDDMLARFKEIGQATRSLIDRFADQQGVNKQGKREGWRVQGVRTRLAFYACHAVSRIRA